MVEKFGSHVLFPLQAGRAISGLSAADNDDRYNDVQTETQLVNDPSTNIVESQTTVTNLGERGADNGFHTMLAYHGDSFFGLGEGSFKAALLHGQGLGAEVKTIGGDGNLTEDATATRLGLYGTTYLAPKWRIAPAILAEVSEDRYAQGDKYSWATFNARLANEITSNFEMQYEASYQFMDLDAAGYKGRNNVDGGYSKFTVAPIGAIEKVLENAGWSADEVDLWEVNEAFACVAMFAMRDIGIPHDKINVNGGGTALGHPIGASGTRIIVTLLNALKQQGKKRGIASLCIGGGEATAVAVEMV